MRIHYLVLALFFTQTAGAYVAGPGAQSEGQFGVSLKTEWMRGLAGPENLPETQQSLKPDVDIYEVAVGYGFGTHGVFQDLRLRMAYAYFSSAQEVTGGTLRYPKDDGGYLGAELSANFVHDLQKNFGVFLRFQSPLGMNLAKFVNPKIDRLGIGVNTAFRLTDRFSQETVLFLGSGILSGGYRQNASIAISTLGVFTLPPSWLGTGAAFRLGPFYEGDIAQRIDLAYGTTVRAFRLGLTMIASVSILDNWAVDLGYTRKFTGAYFRATDDLFLSTTVVF